MSRSSGPIRSVAGRNTANSNAIISQSGTREAGTAADAWSFKGNANATTSVVATFSNASHAQNTVYTVQDCGAAAANMVTSTAGNLMTTTVTLNTAAVTGSYAAPTVLVAAPGAGKTVIVQEATVYTASTGNTAYATGTSPVIQYDSTVHGAGTAATTALATGDLTASVSQIKSVTSPTGALTGITNKGIYFSNATGAYTAGTGTNVVITLTYLVVTATV